MKFSEAMLKGFEQVGGRQCRYVYREGSVTEPRTVCALGAYFLGAYGAAECASLDEQDDITGQFKKAWGIFIQEANDMGLPWEHIYGMAVVAGL